MKLQAGSLLYSLFILIAVGSLLTILLFLFAFSKKSVITYQSQQQVYNMVGSGFETLLSQQPLLGEDERKSIALFDDENEVLLDRYPWGLLEVVGCAAVSTKESYSKYALIGSRSMDQERFYLADVNTSLSLSGTTELHGKLSLPEKGVERAFIAGMHYVGGQLTYGTVTTSSSDLPEIPPSYLERFKNHFQAAQHDSIILWENAISEDSLAHSFSRKTMVLQSDQGVFLNNKYVGGNVKIVSKK